MKKKKEIKIKFLEEVKVKKVIYKILFIIVSICILYNVIFLINTTITKKDYFSLFGVTLFSMENDSMSATVSEVSENDSGNDVINKNDLVIATEKGSTEKELQKGDIIVYKNNKKIKFGKIININDIDGQRQYVAKATNNYYPDNEPISIGQIIGKVRVHIPFLGLILKILQSKVTTLIIVLVLMLRFSYNRYIYRIKVERKKKRMNTN